MKPYQYRIRTPAPPEYNHIQGVLRTGDQEQLTGTVAGMKASDLEERVARAMDTLDVRYDFRVRISSQALGEQRLTRRFESVRGEIEMDFLAERDGRVTPVFVDGSISHFFTPYQAEQDKLKTDIANRFGEAFGWREAVRIPFWKLVDQDMANRTVRDIFI